MSWKVPRMWEGGECWIIGGGPSIPKEFGVPDQVIQGVLKGDLSPSAYSPYLSKIHEKHIIGINMAFHIGDWIDVIFFGDKGFLLKNQKQLLVHPALKVGCCPLIEEFEHLGVKRLLRNHEHPYGISERPDKVSWNGSSGAAAISTAVHTGVKRIILLGFDMTLGETGSQHWHPLYRVNGDPGRKLPFERHKRGFEFIARDAKRIGVEILNASPNSTISHLKKCSVKDLL